MFEYKTMKYKNDKITIIFDKEYLLYFVIDDILNILKLSEDDINNDYKIYKLKEANMKLYDEFSILSFIMSFDNDKNRKFIQWFYKDVLLPMRKYAMNRKFYSDDQQIKLLKSKLKEFKQQNKNLRS